MVPIAATIWANIMEPSWAPWPATTSPDAAVTVPCMRWSCPVLVSMAMLPGWPDPMEKSPWKKNWLNATAIDSRNNENRRPLSNVQTRTEIDSGNITPRSP